MADHSIIPEEQNLGVAMTKQADTDAAQFIVNCFTAPDTDAIERHPLTGPLIDLRMVIHPLTQQGEDRIWRAAEKACKLLDRAEVERLAMMAELTDLRNKVASLSEWALDKSATHHRLAHENPHLRTEHIASSTAYRNLAQEVQALATHRDDA